jgi:hypothetical protein
LLIRQHAQGNKLSADKGGGSDGIASPSAWGWWCFSLFCMSVCKTFTLIFFYSQLNFIKREGWLALLLCSKLAESNVFILIELHFQSDLRLGLVGPASFNFQNTALGVVANSMMSYFIEYEIWNI